MIHLIEREMPFPYIYDKSKLLSFFLSVLNVETWKVVIFHVNIDVAKPKMVFRSISKGTNKVRFIIFFTGLSNTGILLLKNKGQCNI